MPKSSVIIHIDVFLIMLLQFFLSKFCLVPGLLSLTSLLCEQLLFLTLASGASSILLFMRSILCNVFLNNTNVSPSWESAFAAPSTVSHFSELQECYCGNCH